MEIRTSRDVGGRKHLPQLTLTALCYHTCHAGTMQIAGSAFRKQRRGLPLTVSAEVSSTLHVQNYSDATYAWTVASEDSATTSFPPLTLPSGRNPSVLTLPPYTMGYPGSVYALRVDLDWDAQSAVSATVTGRSQPFWQSRLSASAGRTVMKAAAPFKAGA